MSLVQIFLTYLLLLSSPPAGVEAEVLWTDGGPRFGPIARGEPLLSGMRLGEGERVLLGPGAAAEFFFERGGVSRVVGPGRWVVGGRRMLPVTEVGGEQGREDGVRVVRRLLGESLRWKSEGAGFFQFWTLGSFSVVGPRSPVIDKGRPEIAWSAPHEGGIFHLEIMRLGEGQEDQERVEAWRQLRTQSFQPWNPLERGAYYRVSVKHTLETEAEGPEVYRVFYLLSGSESEALAEARAELEQLRALGSRRSADVLEAKLVTAVGLLDEAASRWGALYVAAPWRMDFLAQQARVERWMARHPVGNIVPVQGGGE